MWIMVWILQGLAINLVMIFLDLTHLPLFVMGSLKNGKEMELSERIKTLEHLYLTTFLWIKQGASRKITINGQQL